jgi:hypothetical protein
VSHFGKIPHVGDFKPARPADLIKWQIRHRCRIWGFGFGANYQAPDSFKSDILSGLPRWQISTRVEIWGNLAMLQYLKAGEKRQIVVFEANSHTYGNLKSAIFVRFATLANSAPVPNLGEMRHGVAFGESFARCEN